MTTLKELNEKVWYRFLKVIFILCYLSCFLLLIFITFESNRDYHDPILPNTIEEVLKDPEFYKLDDFDMKLVLSSIDDRIFLNQFDKFDEPKKEKKLFKDYSSIEQDWYISGILEQPVPTTPLKNKYHYTSYFTYNLTKCITYGLLLLICYILIMECIRRSFYYIVIGKICPKE